MAERIQLHIDILDHINDLTFHVYRSEEPTVDDTDQLIMKVDQNEAIKIRLTQIDELLVRDLQTPYAFHVKRHFETDMMFPVVTLGVDEVLAGDLFLSSTEKLVEIHSGEIGVFDGRPVYMDYEYLTMPMVDDYDIESGKEYIGPPAHGINQPFNFKITQDFFNEKIRLAYEIDRSPKPYYYRIYALGSGGSKSPWSDTLMHTLTQSNIYFHLQRSPNGDTWTDITLTNLLEWYDDIYAIDNPINVQRVFVYPQGSKVTLLKMDNPWYHFKNYPRVSYQYRLRAEDDEGQATEWVYLNHSDIFIEPEQVMIRRKLDNGTPSSKDGIDAFTVFTLHKSDVDITKPEIYLTDDQLTDSSVYAYTFFLTDQINMEAKPFYVVSNHLGWKNMILLVNEKQEDFVESDFVMTFELADEVIEIGT